MLQHHSKIFQRFPTLVFEDSKIEILFGIQKNTWIAGCYISRAWTEAQGNGGLKFKVFLDSNCWQCQNAFLDMSPESGAQKPQDANEPIGPVHLRTQNIMRQVQTCAGDSLHANVSSDRYTR